MVRIFEDPVLVAAGVVVVVAAVVAVVVGLVAEKNVPHW